MSLDAHVVARRADFGLDVGLRAGDGEVVVVLGPNGAGKSTLLACLAGLVPLDAGHVTLDGADLDRPAARCFVAAEHRSVGVVFQDHLLFPHLSVVDNVAFGARCRGHSRRDARRVALEWLARMELADRADERPARLSGGQQQRVALARALATAPRLLLLDEPLAALDAAARSQVRHDLSTHLRAHGGATLFVTHDPVDAIVLGDRLVVVEHGQVSHEGTAIAVSRAPRTPYVAELMGTNLFHGVVDARGHVRLDSGFDLAAASDVAPGPAFAAFRPNALALHRTHPEGSPRNVWRATVAGLEDHGERVRVRLAGPLPAVAEVTAGAVAALDIRPGDELWASLKATDVDVYR